MINIISYFDNLWSMTESILPNHNKKSESIRYIYKVVLDKKKFFTFILKLKIIYFILLIS